MSRLASKPIILADGVKLEVKDSIIKVKGPKGELELKKVPGIELNINGNEIMVEKKGECGPGMLGMMWSLINNAVKGVHTCFTKKLEIVGKGWRATVKGDLIDFQLGFSHPVEFKLPKGVSAKQETPAVFVLSSHDKQLLGQVAANIQEIRPVEPYKLKGIRIEGQYLRQKERKTAGA